MDVSGLTQASSKLLDALEKLGSSPGADLRSPSGPGGQPPAELVQAFEDALAGLGPIDPQTGLDQPQTGMDTNEEILPGTPLPAGTEPSQGTGSPYAVDEPQGIARTEGIDGQHSVPQTQGVHEPQGPGRSSGVGGPQAVDGVTPQDQVAQAENTRPASPLAEVQELLGRVMDGSLSPTELYRLQYLLGMLKLQADSGAGVSQQASQGLESLLKQQG